MQVDDLKLAIVTMLTDKEYHSGETLGETLGVSRTAISKNVKQLNELGLDIYSVKGRGYKLSNEVHLLDKSQINKSNEELVEVKSIIGSTNDYLVSQIRNNNLLKDGFTVFAECQTKGRGRRGREWQSPFAANLYLSQYRKYADGLAASSGLSLAIGVAVARVVMSLTGKLAQLKWPNDVLFDNKKLAGILVEAEGQSDGLCHLVIGVGLNVSMPDSTDSRIDQPWTDLNKLSTSPINKNDIASRLLFELEDVVEEYKNNQLSNLYKEWNDYHAYSNTPVQIISPNKVIEGICLGIDETGALLLKDDSTGVIKRHFAGELSLRKVPC